LGNAAFGAISPDIAIGRRAVRVATVERNTKETRIKGRIDLDGTGASEIATGIGFLDHML
jgi:imidazoleglycerol phosphate dehydratase HisB